MYSVTLSACGNPDHKENPYSNIVNGIAVEKDIAVADSIEECQRLVRNYIEDNCLGAGNWTGGRVFENGVRVGYISYNGRYWKKGSKYYLEQKVRLIDMEFRSAIIDELGCVMYWCDELQDEDQIECILNSHPEWSRKCIEM